MDLAGYIAGVFSRWRSGNSRSEAPHIALGKRGERLAARELRRSRMKVLYRNYQPSNGGEIDLVCRDGKTLVFVEVKTRTEGGPGRPADAVDAGKEEALMKGARSWMRLLNKPETPVRLDVVEVVVSPSGRAISTHTRDAFAFSEERVAEAQPVPVTNVTARSRGSGSTP